MADVIASGDPKADARAFRRCLGDFATGVTVITAQEGGQRAGVTVNSFSSLSLDPPLVLWSLKRSSRSMAVFEQATHFAVNILALDQIKASQEFSSDATDKFSNVKWRAGANGLPLLEEVVAVMECRTAAVHDGGDHLLFVGEVERFERFAGKPLLFVQGAYGAATDHPALVAKDARALARQPEGGGETPFTALLSRTYHMLTVRFAEQRQAEGLTENEYRVLAGLYDYGAVTRDELEERRYFARRELDDALVELMRRGDVAEKDGKVMLSEAGRQRRLAIMAHAETFRAKQLAGLTPEEIAAARHVLTKLLHG